MGSCRAPSSVYRRWWIVATGAIVPAVLIACSGPAVAPSGTPTAPATETVTAGRPAPKIVEAIAIDASGRVYGSDCFRHTVYRFEDGRASAIAATGILGFSGDGGPATEAELHCPSGLAFVGSDLFIVDDGNDRVRKVDASGVITTVARSRPAGTHRGSPYEGGVQAAGIAIDSSGNIYIADRDNQVIRRIDSSGRIGTYAGDGQKAYGGDGGAAIEASLSVPINIVIDSSGNLYVSDLGNNRVRKIDVHGIITTFAGPGEAAVSGDGGPALEASFCDPTGLAIDGDGSLYVAGDCGPSGHHVRKINTQGIITTVVGVGSKGYSGDGGLAVDAEINVPSGLAIDGSGILYIADVGNRCIRAVEADGIISSLWCAG